MILPSDMSTAEKKLYHYLKVQNSPNFVAIRRNFTLTKQLLVRLVRSLLMIEDLKANFTRFSTILKFITNIIYLNLSEGVCVRRQNCVGPGLLSGFDGVSRQGDTCRLVFLCPPLLLKYFY